MLINMQKTASRVDIAGVLDQLSKQGIAAQVVRQAESAVVIVTNVSSGDNMRSLSGSPGVDKVLDIDQPFKLASRQARHESTIVNVSGVKIGGSDIVVMAGPCSVESREQILATAVAVKKMGAKMLRGGAYKPRTSPYEFQGLGVTALELLREARELTGLPIVTEVMGTDDVDLVCKYADMLQIGARNMQNFALLRRLATCGKPVMLKRSPAATVREWLLAAEYLLVGGNANVVLCERGVRGFERETRNTLDVNAIALAKQLSHLPVIADPSHATGRRELVAPAAKAAIGAGADGLLIEVHPNPDIALSDGTQSLKFNEFDHLMHSLREPMRRLA